MPVSTNISTSDLSQQKTERYLEGRQGEGGRGHRTAGSKGRMCGIAVEGDFRNMRWRVWTGIQEMGGGNCKHLGERGRKWAAGFMGKTCRYCRQSCHGLAY